MKIQKIKIEGDMAKRIEKISKDKSKRNNASSNQVRIDTSKLPKVE